METQLVNRNDPEQVRVAFKNVDGGGSITTGYGVRLVTTAASFDGLSCVQATAAGIRDFFGIAMKDVPINGFGKSVIWGYMASIAISNVGTSITVTAGDSLKPGAVAGTFFSSLTDAAATTMLGKSILAGATTTISGQTWVSGFVRGF
jgi:hypothetical protein